MRHQRMPPIPGLIIVCLLLLPALCPASTEDLNPFTDGTITVEGSTQAAPSDSGNGPSAPSVTSTAAPAAVARSTSTQAPSSTYVVKQGDSLWKIAKRFLGNGARYWDIVAANKNRYPSIQKNPNLIYPGWQLVIPGASGLPTVTAPPANPAPTGTTVTPAPVGTPAPGAKGGKALLGWLQKTGLKGEALRYAWAIGMKESSGNPRAFNGNARTGDKSYGLFQINMIGSMGPARRKQYGLKSNEELFDPEVNIRVMMKLSRNGTNWGPWGIGPNSYKKTQTSANFEKFYRLYPPR